VEIRSTHINVGVNKTVGPRIRTCDGAESLSDFPSKMRTLEKTVTDIGVSCAKEGSSR